MQLRYPSFHTAARWTYTEGNRALARVPWVDPQAAFAAVREGPKQGGRRQPTYLPLCASAAVQDDCCAPRSNNLGLRA
jgi:hypothetical protein